MAIFITLKEIRNNTEFYEWFKEHGEIIVAPLVLLAGTNIESLEVINSCFAGFKIFSAPTSINYSTYIMWVGTIGYFLADSSQFIIQVSKNLHLINK